MTAPTLTRRRFIQNASAGLAACAIAERAFAATPTPPAWAIGCLNRPWTNSDADEMLDQIVAAGYRLVGLQTPTKKDTFIAPGAKPEYLSALKQKISARGLTANVGRLRTKDTAPIAEAQADIREHVRNARVLGLTTLLHTGTSRPEHYETWYRLMNYAAGCTADAGIQLVTKPHGGVNAAGAELRMCLEKINHRNLGIWYDAGNIIHYTGKDPLQELEPIIGHVTAFTAKDCAAKGAEVMIQFGQGKVDFAALLRRLKKAGFQGPIMVESCEAKGTATEITTKAAANRKFLESTLAAL